MRCSPTRCLIRFQSICRALAYPFLIAAALWVVGRVAAATDGFWSARSYGGVMLAAALGGLALALVRLGDGRISSEDGKSVRRNAKASAAFWLTSFLALSMVILLSTLLQRIPGELETPWLKHPVPSVKPAVCVEPNPVAAGETDKRGRRSGK